MKIKKGQHFIRTALCLAYASRAAYEDDPRVDAEFMQIADWDTIVPLASKSSFNDMEGFVASNEDHVVVAFRGTERDVRDFYTDLRFRHHEDTVGGGKVHAGFWESWKAGRRQFTAAIKKQRKHSQQVWFTGHSLGGALATLAARDLSSAYRTASVFTYGTPRVGDPNFARKYKPTLKRFINESDIAPHLPPRGFFVSSFEHADTGYVMEEDGSITSSPLSWRRRLREAAEGFVFGQLFSPIQAFEDHALAEYIKKLESHSLNQ